MKIDRGGTPVWVSPRRSGGIEIIQGTSRIKLREPEMGDLIRILEQLSNDARAGKKKMTPNGHQ